MSHADTTHARDKASAALQKVSSLAQQNKLLTATVENAKAETRAAMGRAKKAEDRASDLQKTVDCQRWDFSVELSNALQVQATRVRDQLKSEVERVKAGRMQLFG